MARGRRRVRVPARGAASAGTAKAHGKRWEGDEEGSDESQRLTKSSNARGREEEEDTREEGNGAQERSLFGHWHGSPKKKTKEARGPGGRRRRGEL